MEAEGTLQKCYLGYDAWLTCSSHAFSTEKQEVMGLLLGRWAEDGTIAVVESALVLYRSDRQKDRVEVGYEQLAAASEIAEQQQTKFGRECRVIGWYHSHPHITVQPSHVDVRTQGQYQAMDPGFLGLIFSCFSQDISHINRIEVTAFQASRGHSTDQGGIPSNCNCADNAGNTYLSDSIASAIVSGADLNQPGSFGIRSQRRKKIPCPVVNVPLTWKHEEVALEVCKYPLESLRSDVKQELERLKQGQRKLASTHQTKEVDLETKVLSRRGEAMMVSCVSSVPVVSSSKVTVSSNLLPSSMVISTPVIVTSSSSSSSSPKSPSSMVPSSSVTVLSPSSSSSLTSPLQLSNKEGFQSARSGSMTETDLEKLLDSDSDSAPFLPTSESLRGLLRLQHVLMEEEKANFLRSISGYDTDINKKSCNDDVKDCSKINSLQVYHNSAIYQKSLCCLFEEMMRPFDVLVDSASRRQGTEKHKLEVENMRLKALLAKKHALKIQAQAQVHMQPHVQVQPQVQQSTPTRRESVPFPVLASNVTSSTSSTSRRASCHPISTANTVRPSLVVSPTCSHTDSPTSLSPTLPVTARSSAHVIPKPQSQGNIVTQKPVSSQSSHVQSIQQAQIRDVIQSRREQALQAQQGSTQSLQGTSSPSVTKDEPPPSYDSVIF